MGSKRKPTAMVLALALQLTALSAAPIRINSHVPNATARRGMEVGDVPPADQPVKILRSTDHDVIIQISRAPSSYLKNETIRLQITNGEIISASEEGGSVEQAWERSVEVRVVTSAPLGDEIVSDESMKKSKKGWNDRKKFIEKRSEKKLNSAFVATKAGNGKEEKSYFSLEGSTFEEDPINRGNRDVHIMEMTGLNIPVPTLPSILFPKTATEKSNLNYLRNQKFPNNLDEPKKSIRKGLLLKEIEINGKKHEIHGDLDGTSETGNKTVQQRSANLRLGDNNLLDSVVNSAVATITNRRPSNLLPRQSFILPVASLNNKPGSSMNRIDSPSLLLSPYHPMGRASRLESTFDGLDRMVNAMSRIDYYISNSAKHALAMLTHHHNTDYRMKTDDEKESDLRYFRSAPVKQEANQEKLYFLHN